MVNQHIIGRVEALGATILLAFMYYTVQVSSHSAAQLAEIRSIINCGMLGLIALAKKYDFYVNKTSLNQCLVRGFWAMLSIAFNMQCNKLLSITVFSILSRLNTFGVIFLSVFYMGKDFTWKPVVLALVSFLGVTLVVCPSIYGLGSRDAKGIEFKGTPSEYLGLFTAFMFIATNSMGRVWSSKIANDVGICQSVFYLNLCLGLLYSIVVGFDPIEWKSSEWANYLLIGVGNLIYQIIFVDSMKRESDPNVTAIIQSSLIIFTMTIDYFLIGEHISVVNVIGASIVGVATTISVLK